MAKNPTYLTSRFGKWYARVPIPPELHTHFGKTQFRTFLADVRSDALRKSYAVVDECLAQIEKAKRGDLIASLKPDEYLSKFYDRHLKRIASSRGDVEVNRNNHERVEAARIAKDNRERVSGSTPYEPDKLYELYDLEWNLRRQLLRKVERESAHSDEVEAIIGWAVDELILRKEVPSNLTQSQRLELASKLAVVELIIMDKVDASHIPGSLLAPPINPLFDPAKNSKVGSSKVLDDVLPKLHSHRKPAERTIKEHYVAVRNFHDFLGIAKPLTEITPADIRNYRDALLETPVNFVQRFPRKTLLEAIAANKARDVPYPVLDPSTINNKYLSHLRNFFKFATKEGMIAGNPAGDVEVDTGRKSKKTKRLPFEQPDFDLIFNHPIFEEPAKYQTKQWSILLALYTGARSSSEISKLTAQNVFETQGVWVIKFEDGTKNENAVHTVPIHRRLLDIGFLAFVDKKRNIGNQRLFPDWYDNDTVNRWFNRTLKDSLKITDKRKVFHSMRHSLKTALTNAGVQNNIRDRIIPHAEEGAAAIYNHATDESLLDLMKSALDKVQFENLELPSRR